MDRVDWIILLTMCGLALVLLAMINGCSTGSHTDSTSARWRGAVVSDPAVIPTLEAAWLRGPQDWEPEGWTITLREGRFRCGSQPESRGCTSSRRRIDLVADVDVARWELGNARCYDRTGVLRDGGWAAC